MEIEKDLEIIFNKVPISAHEVEIILCEALVAGVKPESLAAYCTEKYPHFQEALMDHAIRLALDDLDLNWRVTLRTQITS